MRVQHPKEKIDIVAWLRNFETPDVILLSAKLKSKCNLFRHQIDCIQSNRELLQKAAQHKKQRLNCFDFVFEFEALLEGFRRVNQLEESSELAMGAFPKDNCFSSKARPQVFFIELRQIP